MVKLQEILPANHPMRELTHKGQLKKARKSLKTGVVAGPTTNSEGLRILRGYEIAAIRLQKGFTQAQLTKKIGARYNILSTVERDRRMLTGEEARRLGLYLPLPDGCCFPVVGDGKAKRGRKAGQPQKKTAAQEPQQEAPAFIIKDALLAEITSVIRNPNLTEAQAQRVHSLFNATVISVLLGGVQ